MNKPDAPNQILPCDIHKMKRDKLSKLAIEQMQQIIDLRNELMVIKRAAMRVSTVNNNLRLVVRDCANTLQYNLSMHSIKNEEMMMQSLRLAWYHVGRDFCELPNVPDDRGVPPPVNHLVGQQPTNQGKKP